MALRNFAEVPYLPMLSLRPAEMRALEELPNRTKDQLLPIIPLRPWVGAHRLSNALQRIEDAYGERPVIIAMGEQELVNDRQVHDELADLRADGDGFGNWCEFISDHPTYIPAIQFGDIVEEEAQVGCLYELNRGLTVIVERAAFGALAAVAQRVGRNTDGGRDVCIVLDFGLASRDHLLVAAQTAGFIRTMKAYLPRATFSVSASSFPDNFVNRVSQPIYERELFEQLIRTPDIGNMVYSDRGSARAERVTGGGGQPAPRIDYPLADSWNFYRSDDRTGFAGYQQQARVLMNSAGVWNPMLRVWGTQMIERTAAGDTSAIAGAQRATAARINLHLQRQTFYDEPEEAEDTDEDWEG